MIFIDFISYLKSQKGGFYPQELRADVARNPRGCNMAHKATWQSHGSPHEGLGGASVTRTRGRATRTPKGHHMASEGAGK